MSENNVKENNVRVCYECLTQTLKHCLSLFEVNDLPDKKKGHHLGSLDMSLSSYTRVTSSKSCKQTGSVLAKLIFGNNVISSNLTSDPTTDSRSGS